MRPARWQALPFPLGVGEIGRVQPAPAVAQGVLSCIASLTPAAPAALPVSVEATIAALPHDAHPMGTILTGLCALSTLHPEQVGQRWGQRVGGVCESTCCCRGRAGVVTKTGCDPCMPSNQCTASSPPPFCSAEPGAGGAEHLPEQGGAGQADCAADWQDPHAGGAGLPPRLGPQAGAAQPEPGVYRGGSGGLQGRTVAAGMHCGKGWRAVVQLHLHASPVAPHVSLAKRRAVASPPPLLTRSLSRPPELPVHAGCGEPPRVPAQPTPGARPGHPLHPARRA